MVDITFPCVIQKYTKFENFADHIFHILQYFATKLDNCMKFRMLFPAVLIDFPNSKVCLMGEIMAVKESLYVTKIHVDFYSHTLSSTYGRQMRPH